MNDNKKYAVQLIVTTEDGNSMSSTISSVVINHMKTVLGVDAIKESYELLLQKLYDNITKGSSNES